MQDISRTVSEGNSRSLEKAVAAGLRDPSLFHAIIAGLHSNDPLIRRRAADVVERVSRKRFDYLHPYKDLLIERATSDEPEIRVELTPLLPRLSLDEPERAVLFEKVRTALFNTNDMLKVISLQTLVTLAENDPALHSQMMAVLEAQIVTGIPVNQRFARLARDELARRLPSGTPTEDQPRQRPSLHDRWQGASQRWGMVNQFMKVAMNHSRTLRKQEHERRRQAPPTQKMMVKELGNLLFYGAITLIVSIALAHVTFPLQFASLIDSVLYIVVIFLGLFGIVQMILCVRNLLTMRMHIHQLQHQSEREK